MFAVDIELIDRAGKVLSVHPYVYWVLGGAGSGKSTICAELSGMFSIPVYDMDEHIYGAYFARYRAEQHPANTAWAAARDGMQWLLDMSWDEFDAYNRAAAAEYLDLFSDDLAQMGPEKRVLVDGGLYHPELLSRVMPRERIVSLVAPHLDSTAVWTGTDERLAMKEMIGRLDDPERAWRTFLEFDANMTGTISNQAEAHGSPVVSRSPSDKVSVVAARVAAALGLEPATDESATGE
jgi:adenylate kinase family enzyme